MPISAGPDICTKHHTQPDLMENYCVTDDVEPSVLLENSSMEVTEDNPMLQPNLSLDETQSQTKNYDELEKYLTDILSGLHKQQEAQKNEVLNLILKQHQEIQNSNTLNLNDNLSTISKIPTIAASTWTFTQGLVLGQLSVIILFIAFIKFFVFTEATPTQASSIPVKTDISIIKSTRKNDEIVDIARLNSAAPAMSRLNTDRESELSIIDEQQIAMNKALGTSNTVANLDYNSTLNSILEKTYYDVKSHQPESLDWFNVLVAQIIAQARLEALNDGNIYESLNDALNSPQVLQYFDKIKITEINIGDDYPIFSNCRVKNNDGRLEAKIDVDVSDTLTLGVDTSLLINQPKFMSASLPIKLAISVVRFSACLTVSLISIDDEDDDTDIGSETDAKSKNSNEDVAGEHEDGNNKDEKKQGHSIALMFSFSPDFRLEFDIKSLIGSRAKLENIPRISSILENVIRKWFIERCIEPRFQLIKLPSMWPRKKNTRHSKPSDI